MPFPVLPGYSINRFGSSQPVRLSADPTCHIRCPQTEMSSIAWWSPVQLSSLSKAAALWICDVVCVMQAALSDLYSLQMPVFLSGSDYRRGRVLPHRRTHGNHYRVGGDSDSSLLNISLCAASSFFLCYSSSWLSNSLLQADAVVLHCLALCPFTHFGLEEKNITAPYRFFFIPV